MKTQILLILLLYSVSVTAQTDTTSIKSWKSYPIPSLEIVSTYNTSPNNWEVYMQDGDVKVKEHNFKGSGILPFDLKPSEMERSQMAGARSVLMVDDGYLVASYRGEFGGSLFWFSFNGSSHYKISGHQIVQFTTRDKKLYAVEGLAHMGLSHGSILQLEKVNAKWTVKQYLNLNKAPHAIQVDANGFFIIVTSPDLLLVDSNTKIKKLIEKGIWYPYLYPSSMVISNQIVYMGMRKGVYKYNLNNQKSEWLMPH